MFNQSAFVGGFMGAAEGPARPKLVKLNKLLEAIQEVDPRMTLDHLRLLLHIGLGESDISQIRTKAKLARSTASRYLLDMGHVWRTGESGMGLLDRTTDPHEIRRVIYSLTLKGRLLLKHIEEIMT